MAVNRWVEEWLVARFEVTARDNGADEFEAQAYANWGMQTNQQPTNDSYRFFHENVEW